MSPNLMLCGLEIRKLLHYSCDLGEKIYVRVPTLLCNL